MKSVLAVLTLLVLSSCVLPNEHWLIEAETQSSVNFECLKKDFDSIPDLEPSLEHYQSFLRGYEQGSSTYLKELKNPQVEGIRIFVGLSIQAKEKENKIRMGILLLNQIHSAQDEINDILKQRILIEIEPFQTKLRKLLVDSEKNCNLQIDSVKVNTFCRGIFCGSR